MNLPIQIALDMLRRNIHIASQQSVKNDGDNPSELISGIDVALTILLAIGALIWSLDISINRHSLKKPVFYQVSSNAAEIGKSDIGFSKVYASVTIKSDSNTGMNSSGLVNKR